MNMSLPAPLVSCPLCTRAIDRRAMPSFTFPGDLHRPVCPECVEVIRSDRRARPAG